MFTRNLIIMTSILHYMSPACAADSPAAQVITVSQETKVNLIAAVIILEAGGEGGSGMKAVSEVIFNRSLILQEKAHKKGKSLNSSSFAASIIDAQYEAVTKKKQFSCLNALSVHEAVLKAKNHKHFDFAKTLVALSAMNGTSNLTNNSNHYCRFDCFPKWRDDKKMTVRIGSHCFFKL